MQSKQTKTFQVQQPIETVWKFLLDPQKVAPCLPGAQITEAVDDRTFKGTITVKIGPVSTQFKGDIKIERIDEQNHEMELAGAGQDPKGGGGARMRMIVHLVSLPDSRTEVTGTSEVSIAGRLAQFGSRMMEDVSNHLFVQFTKNFQTRLSQEEAGGEIPAATEEPQAINAVPLLIDAAKDAIARRFRKKTEDPSD